ncbi:MAG TPA: hypothetical protein VEH30_07675 [Terriglobales bacterium]|nr:hypothetical protein [Terriglobales bacterium]
MATLAVVWRNPQKVQNVVRCSRQARTKGRDVYIVQQLVSVERNLWVNTAAFEVISSHQAVGPEPEALRNRGLRVAHGTVWPRSIYPLFVS